MKITVIFAGCLTILMLATLQALPQDKKATEILDAFKAKTQSYQTIQVEFNYTMENKAEGIHESFHGILYIKGENYRLSIAGQLVICDGETIWTYLEDAQEVQVNSVEDDEESITPSKLFTSYYDDHKSKYAGEISREGKTIHRIELTPTESKSYSKILLEIEKGTLQLVELEISDKSGSTFTYEVTRFLTDVPVGDDKFTFNASAYPDAEIIDMR